MSKKKFKSGLESLFDAPSEARYLTDTETIAENKPRKRRSRRSSSKNFTSDLDALFQEVVQLEELEERDKADRKSKKARTQQHLNRRPTLIGLDALIRRTTEAADEMEEDYQPVTKRVTFAFDAAKFRRLKRIAKQERSYLKDILGSLVTAYIERYEREEDQES